MFKQKKLTNKNLTEEGMTFEDKIQMSKKLS